MKLRMTLPTSKVLKLFSKVSIAIFLFSFVSFSFGPLTAYAQSGPSIADESICSGTTYDSTGKATYHPCKITDLGKVVKGILSLVISIGLPVLVFLVAFRFVKAWFALREGNPNAYKEAVQKAGNAILGFVIIVLVMGGIVTAALKFFGVSDTVLRFIDMLLSSSSSVFVEHAYAADQQYLPNFLSVDNIYDFLLNIIRLAMRFFVYPALIFIWVYVGFSFIYAQGNPEQLSKAKKWLVGAFITTLTIFMVQTFLIAIRGSVQKILPGGTNSSATVPGRQTTTPNANNVSNGGANINGSPSTSQGPDLTQTSPSSIAPPSNDQSAPEPVKDTGAGTPEEPVVDGGNH